MHDRSEDDARVPSLEQHRVLGLIYDVFLAVGDWPVFSYVDAHAWEQLHVEARDTYYALSEMGFVWPAARRDRPTDVRDDTKVGISLQGLTHLREAADDLAHFIAAVRYIGSRAARWRPASPTEAGTLQVTSEEIRLDLGLAEGDSALTRLGVLLKDHAWSMSTGFGGDPSGPWTVTIHPERARRYREIHTVVGFLEADAAIHAAHTTHVPTGLAELVSADDPDEDDLFGLAQRHPTTAVSSGDTRQHHGVPVSTQTIAALAEPFDGGGGLTHSNIELVWASADASDYLGEGNKLDRVLGGLRALRNGRASSATGSALPPDHEKLQAVASELATRLIARGMVDADAVAEALEDEPVSPKPDTSAARGGAASSALSRPGQSTAMADEVAHDPRSVMVVHGQDADAANAMFDWLRAIKLSPLEWTHQVNATGTASPFIGTVVETGFAQARAVVVLFTPDEHARPRTDLEGSGGWRLQARPNVLFEAGMAFATHPERTVLVVLGEQELPSDLAGRHFVRLTSVTGLRDLARRLEAAGCPVDLSGDQWLDIGRFPVRTGLTATPRTHDVSS